MGKTDALVEEFEALRERTSEISWCREEWWDPASLKYSDWVLLDSWYRSRSVELPMSGEAMVPCLDMANHSAEANAHYQQDDNGDVILLLRPDRQVEAGIEVTISYGASKSAAEMLFNYGFIDGFTEAQSMVLHIAPGSEDPLAKAKAVAFGRPRTLRISASEDSVEISCPFVYLMCVGEEDGLTFGQLLQNDGNRGELRVFWQEEDVTARVRDFEELLAQHPLKDVYKLRATVLLKFMAEAQLERLSGSEEKANALRESLSELKGEAKQVHEGASELRLVEAGLLNIAMDWLDAEVSEAGSSHDDVLTL